METFFVILLQCTLSMSVITLLYAVVLPILSKRYTAKWRYIIWLVIAAGWIFPFRPRVNLSFLPTQIADIPVMPIQPIINAMPSTTVAEETVNAPATISVWLVLAVIWILGVGSVVLYHAMRHIRFMKTVRRWSEPIINLDHLETLDNLKTELNINTQVKLSVCQSIASPMLIGFFRPAILLPPVEIGIDELPFILKHELIHYKRHDLWYKALILAATALHWFNPLVYFMTKSAAVQCEISCDALVLRGADFQQRKQYGETIIGVVRNGAKFRTALSTNFYGGKKGMKNRISSIMDTKRKKAGVAVLCIALVGIIMTGATHAAAADNEQTIVLESKNVTFAEETAYVETPESKAAIYAAYEQYGLTYNKSTDQLFYNGELVRYFEDWYPVGDGGSAGRDYLNENGTIDVHGVRDLSQLTHKSDGSFDPSGKLIGVEAYSQAEFEARDIEELKNPPMQATSVNASSAGGDSSTAQESSDDSFSGYTYAVESGTVLTPDEYAELYAVYEPFGLTYDKDTACFYYNGKLVRQFVDILMSNGESLSGGKFKGSMRQIINPDGKGEVDVYTVRDYENLDSDGNGTLTDIKACSQEEFDANTGI